MYSITNNSRAAAVVVGAGLVLAVAFGGFAAPAQAQLNSTQVQAIISLLQSFGANAQTIANVQAALTGGPVSGGGSVGISCTFTRALTIGASGADVTCLQQALIAGGFSIPAGATGYFGEQTRSAVAAWQASRGVSPAAGYFGPISQASWNLNAPGTPTTPGTPPSSGGLQGGAGDITVTERSSGTQNDVLEGENDVRVLGFDIQAEGSDVRITSVRVELNHTGNGSRRLERYADEVCIFMGNRSVGCAEVRDFSRSSNVYSRNIPVDAIVRNNNTERFYATVSALRNVDSNDVGENWVIGVGTIRFTDATGAIITDTTGDGVSGGDNGPISATFTFEDLTSTGDVRLRVTEDDADVNDARTIQVSETSDTNNVELLSFNIEARGSDMELESMVFEISSSGAGVTEIANDFRLMMGNTEVGRAIIDRDCDGGNDGFGINADTDICVRIVDLDDDNAVIDRGDTEGFTLVADINDLEGNFTAGDSFTSVTLNASDIEAENENGDTVTNLTGSANSGPFTFQSSGLTATVTSTPTPTILQGAADITSDDRGQFVMEFNVTAFENTSWVQLTAASSTNAAADDLGVAFYVENASTGAQVTGGTSNAILERVSGGTVQGDYVRINDGQTARFRLTVSYDPVATGFYRVQMHAIGFNQSGASPANMQQVLTPESSYQSASIQIQD
jgi:peptidoglycan hydrolase-like protein with peptidoglycan-binding domain